MNLHNEVFKLLNESVVLLLSNYLQIAVEGC